MICNAGKRQLSQLAFAASLASLLLSDIASADDAAASRRPIAELAATTIHIGKTADWVAQTADAIWVGSTGPNAVSQIDPRTSKLIATVPVPGEPCAGLAVGFGSLWVPLCAKPNALVRVDLKTRAVSEVTGIGPAAAEGGITISPDNVWLILDAQGVLARIDPTSNTVRQTIRVPPGSYNPHYADGEIWITRADGAELSIVNAMTGERSGNLITGPMPRFLTSGAGAIWTLNQGDGTLTRVEIRTRKVTGTVDLGTPGKGGDIKFGRGMVWTTMEKVPLSMIDGATGKLLCQWAGPGGDSLAIHAGAIWLTDYNAGTISRLEIRQALQLCRRASSGR